MLKPFGHRILLVDDEVIITTQIEEFLTFEGYHVVGIMTSGTEAIEAVQTLNPDIVVMDIMMPGRIDGIAAARQIMDRFDIPVIFLTAYADEKLLTRAKPLDPFGYVLKPVQEKQLIVAIELGLYKKEMEARLLETYQQLTQANHRLQLEIEEHQQARSALRRNEIKYRTLVENIPDVVYSLDAQRNITTINPSIKHYYGYKSRDIIGHKFTALIHPPDREHATRAFDDAIKLQQTSTRGLQFRIVGQEGKTYWVERNAHMSFDDDGNFKQEEGVLRDITAPKRLQEQLIRSERLSATGQLAASIAHEINSPLQAATLMLNTLRTNYRHDQALSENTRLITQSFDSIKATVKTLIDLNRPSQAIKQLTNVNAVVVDTVHLIKFHLQHRQIKIDLQLSQDLPMITAAPQQLSHVILALLNNAVEAFNITNAPETSDPTAKTITFTTSATSDSIIVHIADNGPGIPTADLNRIFDPFFTRKKPKGIGIGLSLCNGIIKDHHGVIAASSPPQGGAAFTIQLPIQSD